MAAAVNSNATLEREQQGQDVFQGTEPGAGYVLSFQGFWLHKHSFDLNPCLMQALILILSLIF